MYQFAGTGMPECITYRVWFHTDGAGIYGARAISGYRGHSLAIDGDISVQDVAYDQLKALLMEGKQVLKN